jgi:LPS export ABC transporter protein LptC/lipopolysaccharide transport protein LptA
MQEVRRKRAVLIGLRARVPLVLRLIAGAALVAVFIYAGMSLYRSKSQSNFVLHNGKPELSNQVVSTVEGYERRVTDGDRLTLLVTAARDITYSDNHHELETVKLESYRTASGKPNRVTAARAIYLPAAGGAEQGLVTFTGKVEMESDNGLLAHTETVSYDTQAELATTADPITFSRENVSGQATGARVDNKNERLELDRDVQITIDPKPAGADATPSAIARSQPMTIKSGKAVFDQKTHRIDFTGSATAEQARDIISGDTITAWMSEKKKVQKVEVRQNAYLRTMNEGRAAEVHAVDMGFDFDANQQLQHAVANKDVKARTLDADAQMQLTGATNMDILFALQQDKSVLKELKASGRSVMTLAAPQSHKDDPKAANKRLTADAITMDWRDKGRDLEKAEANGNAELYIEPVVPSPTADKQTLTAPNFLCEFYETGNLAKTFTATGNAKVVLEPMQAAPNRFVRTIYAQKMAANFVRETQALDRYEANGDAKFVEEDRNGVAANGTYTAADEMMRLRGGDPTVWDSRARTKASELDSDTKQKISYGRGKVSTTYYSQEQTGGATPFTKTKSPVFVTADRVEFHHVDKVAVYTGNCRAWQDDNFVKSDRLTLRAATEGAASMLAETRVQSALYQVKKRGGGAAVPAFASSDRMTYDQKTRLLHYEGNADVRQGTDRMTGNSADVYMSQETNEVERTVAEQNVVLTQPGRRGTGDWAQYTVADDTFVLKGKPAHVDDAEQGTTDAQTLTVYMKENKVVADNGSGTQTPGRGRSTHKVTKP